MPPTDEILRIPIAKSVRHGRECLVFGWAAVPHPVLAKALFEPGQSLEQDIEDVRDAYNAQFPNDNEAGDWRFVMATFSDHVIVEAHSDAGSQFLQHNFIQTDGGFTFGEGIEVERVFVAKALADQADARRLQKASPKIDLEGDRLALAELEKAAYTFTMLSGRTDIDHDEVVHGQLVESVVITDEKLEAMGVPEDARASVNKGWWLGFKVDEDTMDRVESGDLTMFSIGGSAKRTPAA